MVGAYKTAPTRCLETEAWVPPLDLYLNKRLADFEARLRKKALQVGAGGERTTAGHLISHYTSGPVGRSEVENRGEEKQEVEHQRGGRTSLAGPVGASQSQPTRY